MSTPDGNTLRVALERIAAQGCNGERATETACGTCVSCFAREALTASVTRPADSEQTQQQETT